MKRHKQRAKQKAISGDFLYQLKAIEYSTPKASLVP